MVGLADWDRLAWRLGRLPGAGWDNVPGIALLAMQFEIIEELSAIISQAASNEYLHIALGQTARRLGFDHFALSFAAWASGSEAPSLLLHDYPAAWAQVYVSFDLAGTDPVRRACDKALGGFEWRTLERLIPMTRGDRQMLAVGRECGIADGYTVPRHLPGEASGSCTFAICPGRTIPRAMLVGAEILGAMAVESAARLCGLRPHVGTPVLSDRQRECLIWSARGKTAGEIASILDISSDTVNEHLKHARERYDVHCKQSLIVRALFDGLIGFSDIFRWRSR